MGGAASSDVAGIALADSQVRVQTDARGGRGGDGLPGFDAGDGAAATATGTAVNPGATEVGLDISATGGAGGDAVGAGRVAGAGGDALARATGTSTGGATVYVGAYQFGGAGGSASAGAIAARGADTRSVDAVDGSTSGLLRLFEFAGGGDGGDALGVGDAAAGGEGRVVLSARNPGGGALHVIGSASGGDGGSAGAGTAGRGGDGVLESLIGTSDIGAPVRVTAVVQGGAGGNGFLQGQSGDGGGFSLGTVSGSSSGGGEVVVGAHALGGNGGDYGGNGADSVLVNAVHGETTGSLELWQLAVGGWAGSRYLTNTSRAGSASSELSQQASVAALSLVSSAQGGGGGAPITSLVNGGDGGVANARVDGVNDAGRVAVIASAQGGEGGWNYGAPLGGNGAAASVMARASSLGDGHEVSVGRSRSGPPPEDYDDDAVPRAPTPGAFGGQGGAAYGDETDALAGDGGDATSASEGVALGNSRVSVYDFAQGGDSGIEATSYPSPSHALGGRAGNAASSAIARGAGSAAVHAEAEARGGQSGSETGGDAEATSLAEGGGLVDAIAIAVGGRGGNAGAAHALATASGESGSVLAQASSGRGFVRALLATASAPVASRTTSEAGVRFGGESVALSPQGEAQAFAFAHAALDSEATQALIGPHDEVANAFATSTGSPVALLTLGGAAATSDEPQSMLMDANVEMALDIAGPGGGLPLAVGFFDPVFEGDGFAALAFQIEREGVVVLDASFEDLAAALAFFDDEVIGLGDWDEGVVGDLDLSFALTLRAGDPGSSFSFTSIVGSSAVPEPSTLMLFAAGLCGLARRARRASYT
jgi:hypothetical protein